jgi:hypothetical protein
MSYCRIRQVGRLLAVELLASTAVLSGASTVVAADTIILPGFNLSNLDGTKGFRLNGVLAGNNLGAAVGAVGDIDGDSVGDIVVTASSTDELDGRAYLVFGKANRATSSLGLPGAPATDALQFSTTFGVRKDPFAVAPAGDVNHDGIDDFILGESYSSVAYVVFGGSIETLSTISNLDLSLDGTNGTILEADSQGFFGNAVSSAGDVNGDGIDDVIIGDSIFRLPYGEFTGAAYVYFGRSGAHPDRVPLEDLDGSNGFRLLCSRASESCGSSVSSAGDINGDGFDDVIVGGPAPSPAYSTGRAYVVYGKAEGFNSSIDLTALDGTDGFRVELGEGGDRLGSAVSRAGDVNGDGIDDFAVAAPTVPGADDSMISMTFVIFGRQAGFPSLFNPAVLNGENGYAVICDMISQCAEGSLALAGDVNGDGFDDIMIGAPYADAGENYNSGGAFVVFGTGNSGKSLIDLASINGQNGFKISHGKLEAYAGRSVSAGDVNGDGETDFIVGAEDFGNGGKVYVAYGGAAIEKSGAFVESSAEYDGQVTESSENSGKGGVANATTAIIRLGDNSSDQQTRGMLSFDTSPIPDGATITSVKLFVRGEDLKGNPFKSLGKLQVDIKRGSFGGNPAMASSDFQAASSAKAVVSLPSAPNGQVASWFTRALPSSAFGKVNKAGITQFRLHFAAGDDDDRRGDFLAIFGGDAAASKPYLIVTYTEP